mmetsp:Transcript_29399/g.44438  ORF Transcript_29399/g.44438 Transcript_29399/m.44438 type:complete len:156 (+) Transcript_29399:981-1448(+)
MNIEDVATQEDINKTTLIVKNILASESKDAVQEYIHYILHKFQAHLRKQKRELRALRKKQRESGQVVEEDEQDYIIGDQAVHVPADYNKLQYILDIIKDCDDKILVLRKQKAECFENFSGPRLTQEEPTPMCQLNYVSNLRQKAIMILKEKNEHI